MTDILFERKAKITVIDLDNNQELDILSEDSRIVFAGQKSIDSLPNLCTIDIYNPSSEFVSFSSRENLRIDLETAYSNSEFSILFTGDLKRTYFPNINVDNIFRMDVGDAEKAITDSFINKSYLQGIEKSRIITDCVNIMGVDVLTNTLNKISGFYNGGYACFDKCVDILDNIINSTGLEFSIQDNQLVVDKAGIASTIDFKEVSYNLGLIDKPIPLQDGGYLLKNYLDNEFMCHKTVFINTEETENFYQVRQIDFQGDTDRNKWESNIICQ